MDRYSPFQGDSNDMAVDNGFICHNKSVLLITNQYSDIKENKTGWNGSVGVARTCKIREERPRALCLCLQGRSTNKNKGSRQ